MKLAIVMKDYDESKGGAERYLAGLLPKLLPLYDSVDLIVNRCNGKPSKGVNVKLAKAARWSSVFYPLLFNWSVQDIIRRNNYDIVFGLTQIYPQDVYRAGGGLEHSWFDIQRRTLLQRAVNLLNPRVLVRLYIENRIFQKGNFKKIITNSNLCKDQILCRYNISPSDIVVIYNGVENDRFNPNVKGIYMKETRNSLQVPSDAKVILFMSNNWKRKGLLELMEAFGKLDGNNIWLFVGGRGDTKYYSKVAEKLMIRERIKFIGHVKDPEKYYGASDVFVLPTYYDPCANVCIEALTCGLPVVTTNTNGASELVVEGKNGFVVSFPVDIRELKEVIERALKITAANIGETIKDFALDVNIQKTCYVLNNLKNGKSSNILINEGYKELLDKNGWNSFENIMETKEGVQFKKNKLRSVVKINIGGESMFLKRHYKKAVPSWAQLEWQNVFRLKALGINTMEPVAFGEKGERSFIITKSLESVKRLENVIKEEKPNFIDRKILIKALASLTKKMHDNNLFHKDFYIGHIFIQRENERFKVYLIDLQRLQRHWFFKNHWRIKDLAALNYSSQNSFVDLKDRIRFMKYYLNVKNFRNCRTFADRIIKKTGKISRHTEKLLLRRDLI